MLDRQRTKRVRIGDIKVLAAMLLNEEEIEDAE